ncbi:MAG TPA: heme-binding protein [Polyangiaceae bacterium]|nr:heme-binding protein [Polyangiaceae bacterium]
MRALKALTLDEAMQMLRVVQTRLDEKQLGAAVAVVDAHGELLAFLRTDSCRLPCVTVAINKAYTAARERIESQQFGADALARGFPLTNYGELRYVTWGGGIPVRSGGEVVGAVGVSGLSEEEDVELALLAVSVVST